MRGIGVSVDGSARGVPGGLREVLDRTAGLGFSHVELSAKALAVTINGELEPRRLDRLRAALDGLPLRYTLHGTEVSSSRGGNLMDVTTTAQRRIVAADLELAAAIGAEVLVYHSGTLRDPYGDDSALEVGMGAERDALRQLGDRAGEAEILIAVENRDPVARYIVRRSYGLDLLRLAEQLDAVGHPQVRMCFDTGHAFLSYTYLGKGREGYLADLRQIAPMVGHIHLTDNFGKVQLDAEADPTENLASGDGDLHLPPGWGAIPLDEVFAIPFERNPIVNLEIKGQFHEHLDEAYETTRRLVARQSAPVATR